MVDRREENGMKTPYKAEQVGSLLRPTAVLDARKAFSDGRTGLEALRRVEDEAIAAALRRQREIGLEIVSDGEMRRGSWLTDMAEAVEGFVEDRVMLEWKGPGGQIEATTARVAGAKLHKARPLTAQEVPFLTRTAGGPFKITLPAPSNFMFASYKRGITDKVYADRAALLADLVQIIHDEILWLVQQGVSYIQFDAPYYSHYLDAGQRERFRQEGLDPDREFEAALAGDNAALRGIDRSQLTCALHVCRGNSRSRWYTEGAYDAVAEKLFGTLDVDTFLLEYDDERSGGFQPLRLVPSGKNVVLGLITTKHAALESGDALLRRIDEAARYVRMADLAISPQCGFASIAVGNLLSEDDQWRKLELVVDTARKVWGRS
jgi:5-methyltetrahydropteroyltriglutamate--homocysteine methyltransferase